MSTLKADTIQNTSGGAVTLTKQSAAKAWVNFDGTGTVAIRGSQNVSSLTDNGTGDYLCGAISAMADQNYSASGAVAGAAQGALFMRRLNSATYRATTTFGGLTLFANNTSGSGATADYDEVDMKIHGDLA